MRNKILIVDSHAETRKELEQILQEVVEEGGALFFAEKKDDGLTILKKEHPQLVFLDADLIGEDQSIWVEEGVHLILMRQRHESSLKGENELHKPLKSHQVLEKCRSWLGKEPVAQIPPM